MTYKVVVTEGRPWSGSRVTDCNGVPKGPFSHSLLFFILLIVVFSLVMLGSLLIHESQFMAGMGSMGKVDWVA